MATKYLIGVDLGTSATKAALYTPGRDAGGRSHRRTCRFITHARGWWSRRTTISTPPPRRRCAAASRKAASTRARWRRLPSTARWPASARWTRISSPATRFDSWLDMRCQPYIDLPGRAFRRAHHPPDRLPADLRPRAEDLVVEGRGPRGVRAHRQICHPGGLRGRAHGRAARRASLHGLYLHPFLRLRGCRTRGLVGGAVPRGWAWIWASCRRSSSRGA